MSLGGRRLQLRPWGNELCEGIALGGAQATRDRPHVHLRRRGRLQLRVQATALSGGGGGLGVQPPLELGLELLEHLRAGKGPTFR